MFFLCDPSDFLDAAREIDDIPDLTFRARFTFSMAPVRGR